MKSKNFYSVLFAFGLAFATHSAHANTKLADVMGLLGDQLGELNVFSRSVAADAQARAFARAQSRCRAGVILFDLIDSKKGSVDAAGALVAGDFTPTKIENLTGQDLQDKLDEFAAFLKKASDQFTQIEAEIAAQAALVDANARDFTALRALLGQLSTTMREAHKAFR